MPYPDSPPLVIVDVSNVAHAQPKGPPLLRYVTEAFTNLREARIEFDPYVDAALFHQIDDWKGLRELLREPGKVDRFFLARTPPGQEADVTMIDAARYILEERGRPVYSYVSSADPLPWEE